MANGGFFVMTGRLAFHACGVLVLTFYGWRVCPFIERLEFVELAGILAAAMLLGALARAGVDPWLERREGRDLNAGLLRPGTQWFFLELAVWVVAGVAFSAWNLAWYGFPIFKSGTKMLAGCVTLGIFAAAHHLLERQGLLMDRLVESGNLRALRTDRFDSIATRLVRFMALIAASGAVVILLLFQKQFLEYSQSLLRGHPYSFRAVVLEVVYVTSVLLICGWLVARKLAANLARLFALQLAALAQVRSGHYDTFVPLVSNDEFSRIAQGTNEMIEGLKERQRLQRAFGKYVSPQVADAILKSEQGAELGRGREAEVAVLFTDLRGFTALSEGLHPSQVVELLNEHFTGIVEAVHRRGGVVDKFIGDAAMAVFGLQGPEGCCDAAVEAALEMRDTLTALNARLAGRGLPSVEHGAGIHFGPVVAGNIGSPDRLEYTVIGDTVNTASRLESLTKELGRHLVLSAAVLERLSSQNRARFDDLGERAIRGKADKLRLYGAAML